MKLSAVNLRTARLPEMVSFYRDLLGLPCQERVPGRWEIQVGDLCLALVQGENVPPPDPENCLLEFAVEDALAQYRRITGLGLSPPRASPPTCPGAAAISPSKTRTATVLTSSRSSDTKRERRRLLSFFIFPLPFFLLLCYNQCLQTNVEVGKS